MLTTDSGRNLLGHAETCAHASGARGEPNWLVQAVLLSGSGAGCPRTSELRAEFPSPSDASPSRRSQQSAAGRWTDEGSVRPDCPLLAARVPNAATLRRSTPAAS